MINFDDVAISRLSRQKQFSVWRQTVHNFRCIVAGDVSSIGMGESQADISSLDRKQLYDVVIRNVQDGKSNELFHAIKTLAQQVAMRMPEFTYADISIEEELVNNAYLMRLLGPSPRGCNATDQMTLSLMDYLISGYGFQHITMDSKGKPGLQYCDSLDVTWDQSSPLVVDMKWASRKVRRPLYEWVDMFGNSFMKHMGSMTLEKSYDEQVELEFYYDIGCAKRPLGSHYVILSSSKDAGGIVHKEDNPFSWEIAGGEPTPFLPIEAMYFMQLPSVRFGISIIQMMLASQIQSWKLEDNMNQTLLRAVGFYATEKGAMDDVQKKTFLDNRVAGVVELEAGKGPPMWIKGAEVSQSEIMLQDSLRQRMNEMSGKNPFVGGGMMGTANFSSEVAEVSSVSSLTPASIAKDYTAFYERCATKLLKAGGTYDYNKYELTINGEILEFDSDNPVSFYLRPDADLIIREDSTQYKSRSEQMQEGMMQINSALQMASLAPNAPIEAYTQFLRVIGVKDPKGYMFGNQEAGIAPAGAEAGMDPGIGAEAGMAPAGAEAGMDLAGALQTNDLAGLLSA